MTLGDTSEVEAEAQFERVHRRLDKLEMRNGSHSHQPQKHGTKLKHSGIRHQIT